MSDKIRAEFEAWLEADPGRSLNSLDDYWIDGAWVAWQASRLAALEECAKVCEAEAKLRAMVDNVDGVDACYCCANAIRALATDNRPEAKD